MADSSKILLSGEENSEQIKIDPSVLEVILGIAAEKVDGVAGMRGSLKSGLNWVFGREDHGKGVNISVDDDDKLIADIYVYLESGVNVPKVAMTLQKKLKAQLLQMTDLELKAINVHVVGLVFPEDENTDQTTSELFPEDEEEKVVATLNLKQLSAYSKKLIEGVLEDRKNLQSELTSHLKKGWRLERVSQTVVAIMEVALFEINHSDEIDAKAAVNEALNLCDEFAEPKEKPFINGMLANFVK